MSYGKVYKLLRQEHESLGEVVLIESPFLETTRLGTPKRSVILALTARALVIVRKIKNNNELCYSSLKEDDLFEIRSTHQLEKVKLNIFKRSKRQVLKLSGYRKMEKYYELGKCNKRKIFWDLWCQLVCELNKESKKWPFTKSAHTKQIKRYTVDAHQYNAEIPNLRKIEKAPPSTRRTWTDKYLYLGSKREAEDTIRPVPIPGLGQTEEVKLLYLKPQCYVGVDLTEHWVQCGQSISDATNSYKIYTYTGEPTSNIAYTSLMTTWK